MKASAGWLAWVGLGLLFLCACQAAGPAAPAAVPTLTPSVVTQPISEPMVVQTATPLSATPIGGAAQGVLRLCLENLSQRLNLAADQIKVVKITPVTWQDASLGCPKPGIDYVRVETSGYSISLQAGGKQYTYHTNQSKRTCYLTTVMIRWLCQ